MANFVLVHGAWHGGWCWQKVVDGLRERGHQVIAPTLTGLAERRHLLTADVDLDTHIADIVTAARDAGFDRYVLCGHSYGGMVITGVAEVDEAAIDGIVYLDAFVPGDGQSAAMLGAVAVSASDTVDPFPASLFAIADPAQERWVDAMMTPHPARTITQALRVTGAFSRIPYRAYILADRFRAAPHFHDTHAALSAEPGWKTIIADVGHHIMIDDPALVIATLEEALQGASNGTTITK